MDGLVGYLVSLFLGGGLLKAVESVYRAVTETRQKKILTDAVGAKTPAEIESISVTTMATALESAENRIKQLVVDRESDRLYYLAQITELKTQLDHVRSEMQSMEQKISELLADTQPENRNVN